MRSELKKFSPEFLGRVHSIVEFDNLSRGDLFKMMDLHTGKINAVLQKMDVNFPEVQLDVSEDVKEFVVDK